MADEFKTIDDFELFKSRTCADSMINTLYYIGERKVNIVHAQLRMYCSDLKAHLKLLHVIDDPNCNCQMGVEDTHHFFFICPLYHTYRLKLAYEVNKVSAFTLHNILYGDNTKDHVTNVQIFNAVHEFIKESGRFQIIH